MVCGIVGLVFLGNIGLIIGPIAICLGIVAKKKIHQEPQRLTGDCQATAGIIMGSISLAISIILIVLFLVLFIAAGTATATTTNDIWSSSNSNP
jgi:uncharacterized membrane protein HdeD (DUF308 family)